MPFKSLKSYLYIIFFVILLQLVFIAQDLYYHNIHGSLEEEKKASIEYERNFLETLALEKDAELNPDNQRVLLAKYRELETSYSSYDPSVLNSYLKQRVETNREMFVLWGEKQQLHTKINKILPTLADSVSYIHEHHIVYMKNLIRRNGLSQDYDIPEPFNKKTDHAASELDIILAAIEIQNSMVGIVEVFSRLQRGISPNDIHEDFNSAITQFYTATTVFENYSLDAQDGILVEELVINGNLFEDSFKQFLQIESEIIENHLKLNQNRSLIFDEFSKRKTLQQTQYESFNNKLEVRKRIALGISICVLIILLFLAHRIIQALGKIVNEAQKIQSNHSYRIPLMKSDFREVNYIFNTLNFMGETVENKLNELASVQSLLERKVDQRTEELSLINKQLQEEMAERLRNEEHNRDLVERLQRAEKMEALGTLAGGVAHDLNNILSGLVSIPELLLMDIPEDHHLFMPLQAIRSSGDKAAIIVQDLLTMARRGVASHEYLDLNKQVEELVTSPECTKIMSDHPNVELRCELQAEIASMNGSKVHLHKCVINLISNAAESITQKGVILLRTSTHYIDTAFQSYDHVLEGEYIKLSVEDTGGGIAPENINRIFEPFFTTKSMGRSGSGLGMAVVWGTVKDHGGYIDVSSTLNEGTVFNLYFPLQREVTRFTTEKVDINRLEARGEKILVVDDIADQRAIATMMLSRLGYSVDTVDSGEAAVEYLKDKQADILVLDMVMQPGIDGLETYKRVIEFRPHQKAIIVSGFSESDKVIEAQKLGTGAYVKKPYTVVEIAEALRAELDKE